MNQSVSTVPSNTATIFNEINKTISVVGEQRFLEILRESRRISSILTPEQIITANEIIKTICGEFEISIDDFFSSIRKNNRRYAIGVCAIFLQNILGIDNIEVAHILKKPASVTSTYRSDVLHLKNEHPQDHKILQKIENIKSKLK